MDGFQSKWVKAILREALMLDLSIRERDVRSTYDYPMGDRI